MSLPPMLQQPLTPYAGSQGQFHPNPQGTLPYKPSAAVQVMDGMTSFVNNYLQSKQATEAHYRSKVLDALQLNASTGMPFDSNELAKWMQKAGMPVPKVNSPEEAQYITQQLQFNKQNKIQQEQTEQAQQQMLQNASSGPAGLAAMAANPQIAQQAAQPPLQPPTPPLPQQHNPLMNMLSGVSQRLGITHPTIDPRFTQSLQQMGSENSISGELARKEQVLKEQAQMMGLNNEAEIQHLTGSALHTGDPRAIDMLTHLGRMSDLKGDDYVRLINNMYPNEDQNEVRKEAGKLQMYQMMGGPQMKLKILEMAQQDLPRFADSQDPLGDSLKYHQQVFNGQPPTVTPNYSWEEKGEINKLMENILKNHIVPENVARTVALSQFQGDKSKDGLKMSALLSQFPTVKQAEMAQTAALKNAELSQAAQLKGAELEKDYKDQALRGWIGMENIQTDRLKALQAQFGDASKPYMDIIKDPEKYGTEQYNKAVQGLAALTSGQASIPVQYNGQTYTVPTSKIIDNLHGVSSGGAFGVFHPQSVMGVNPSDPASISKMIGNLKNLTQPERQRVYNLINPAHDPHTSQMLSGVESKIKLGEIQEETVKHANEMLKMRRDSQDKINSLQGIPSTMLPVQHNPIDEEEQ